jgi:RNA polymerase sigma-70 factor, ECF subfamily
LATDGDELAGLMAAYQQGDGAAFERLYAELAGPLLGYLRALSRDAVRADDLLQETFLQIHRSRHTYLPGRPLKPWAYAVARHVFLMSARAQRRRGKHETLADEELPDLPVPPEVESLGARDQVRRAVAGLPTEGREALLLHHVMGLSFREIAAVQGISEGAARVRAHRAMAVLRQRLVNEGAR